MKKEFDINGIELQHGDKVVTIELNGKARGGNLVTAYVHKLNPDTPATLVFSEQDLHSTTPRTYYRLYTRLQNKTMIIRD